MTNFFMMFEAILLEIIERMEVKLYIPIHIDIGDEGTDINFAAGVCMDTDSGEKFLMFNAVSPWWREGNLKQKILETVRHELRHLFQEQYLIDRYGFDQG